jgi:Domain of unknown function (DUF5667)
VLAVNASLFERARTERFAQLLDEASGARRHHARVRLDEELAELVQTGQKLRSIRFNNAPTRHFKAELRARLIATAEREGIGVTAAAKPRSLKRRTVSARPRARGAIVVGIAAGTLALSGVSVASGEAIPGDTLYGMKRSTERAQLALAGSDASRGQLYLEFARTRLQEAYAVRSSESGFISSLRDMDEETQQGIRVLVGSAINQHDTTALDTIDRFLVGQRMLVAQMLNLSTDAGRQKVTESLELLTRVGERSKATRAALACGAGTTGADQLGPVPTKCGTAKTQQGAGTGGQSTAQQSQPGSAEGGTTDPQPQASAPASPVPEKKGDGLLDKLGRILSGLLG